MSNSNDPTRRPAGPRDVSELLGRFAAEEDEFLRREFLAPALPGGKVRVRIAGVACTIQIEPADFEGWGIFKPESHTHATLVRRASLAERRAYLELFPQVRLIICHRTGATWSASTASSGDTRMRIDGLAPVLLAEEVQLFDCVRTRYDGTQFWFDEIDMRHDPGTAAYLRGALRDETVPEDLDRRGLTAEERAAYELNYWETVGSPVDPHERNSPQRNAAHRRRSRRARASEEPVEIDSVRQRLRDSLSHAGAELVDYLERSDSFRVSYVVGGQSYTSSVDKQDLTVNIAGICLSGEDRKFDLGSLVGVLREGAAGGDIYQVGGEGGMDEEEYWRIHPPRNE